MVTFHELRNAKPALWTTAADDMRSAARQCERARDDIHNNGVQPLNEHWSDHVGTLAKDVLTSVAGRAEIAAILARSSVDPLDTLNHAVTIAQNELDNGVQMAQAAGLSVDPVSGQVGAPPGMSQDELNSKLATMMQAQQIINDAVEAATQADGLCAGALERTTAHAGATNVGEAQAVQADNTRSALNEIRDTLPDGLPADQVQRWWSHLTAQEQYDLERASPVELYKLQGIPDSVKTRIDRPELGYSSVGAVQYAVDNYQNSQLDIFKDNCTNFVSDSLHYGGAMKERNSSLGPIPGGLIPPRFDTDGWSDGGDPNSDTHWSHTPTWAAAQNNRDFFLDNGGTIVDPTQARPGDIVYYTMTQNDPGASLSVGETHHAAIVTGVLPDGQVLYTQHSDPGLNLPLYGRLPEFEQNYGQQTIEIVQPRVTW